MLHVVVHPTQAQGDERETFPVDQSPKISDREGTKSVRRRNAVLNNHTDWSLMAPPASRQLFRVPECRAQCYSEFVATCMAIG